MTEVTYEIVSNQDGKVCVEEVKDGNYRDNIQYVKVTVDNTTGNVTNTIKQVKGETGNILINGVVAATPATTEDEDTTIESENNESATGVEPEIIDEKTAAVNLSKAISTIFKENGVVSKYKYNLSWLPKYIISQNKSDDIPTTYDNNKVANIVKTTINGRNFKFEILNNMLEEIINNTFVEKKGGFSMKSLTGKLFGTKRRFVKRNRFSRRVTRKLTRRPRRSFRKRRSTRRR